MSHRRFGAGASSTSRRGRRVDSFHVTLAFLGAQPRSHVDAIAEIMSREAAVTEPFVLAPVRLSRDALRRHARPRRLERAVRRRSQIACSGVSSSLGVYERERRPWLPHVTVLRFRERPGLDPPLPEIESFAPSGAAALLSRLHPSGARYEVLESCSLGTGG